MEVSMIDLFKNLLKGEFFHYGDRPTQIFVKKDDNTYIGPMGDHPIHPHVAVIPQYPRDKESKGDSNVRSDR
jgi:hypothetical protein